MAAIRRFLRGRDTMAITIVPQDVSAAGVLTTTATTADNSVSLIGRCDGIRIMNRLTSEVIMSVDDILENNVPLTEGYSIELTEILTQKTGTGGVAASAVNYEPALPYLYNKRTSGVSTYDYFKITVTKGANQYVVYGLKQELSDGVNGQGKQIATMSLLPVNVNFDASGVASIVYT